MRCFISRVILQMKNVKHHQCESYFSFLPLSGIQFLKVSDVQNSYMLIVYRQTTPTAAPCETAAGSVVDVSRMHLCCSEHSTHTHELADAGLWVFLFTTTCWWASTSLSHSVLLWAPSVKERATKLNSVCRVSTRRLPPDSTDRSDTLQIFALQLNLLPLCSWSSSSICSRFHSTSFWRHFGQTSDQFCVIRRFAGLNLTQVFCGTKCLITEEQLFIHSLLFSPNSHTALRFLLIFAHFLQKTAVKTNKSPQHTHTHTHTHTHSLSDSLNNLF